MDSNITSPWLKVQSGRAGFRPAVPCVGLAAADSMETESPRMIAGLLDQSSAQRRATSICVRGMLIAGLAATAPIYNPMSVPLRNAVRHGDLSRRDDAIIFSNI